jgi:hypothetical protein
MYKKPEISPEAACSNIVGLKTSKEVTPPIENATATTSGAPCAMNIQSEKNFETSLSKKRKDRATEASKRHKDKMQRVLHF